MVSMQCELGRDLPATGCARHGYAIVWSRNDRSPGLPGAKPSTYRTTGTSREHRNLVADAGHAKPGKPTSPATSSTGGRASVVVGARESRVQGEGRQ